MALSLIYQSPFKILSNQLGMIRRLSMGSCIVVHPRIEAALRNKAPIVALETAVLTHGMPFPFNVKNALATESIVEREGAIPATIGVIKGRIHVGLDRAQIKFLADGNKDAVKVSRRDLPFVLAKNLSGGTTVSGTLVACHLTGIPLFVTGGIGGVHRGGERSLDVSSDLTELGKTSVAVVSAGVKSILDVGRTLEYLETQGVCVSVVGSSSKFPDFFTRDSGFEAPSFVSNCQEAAVVMLKRQVLNLSSGILFAVPIPEEFECSGILLKKAIEQALQEAESQNVQGRAVTPFVLQRVNEITEGRSLITNMNLLKNNAKVGAQIAVAFSELENHHSTERESLQRKTDVPTPVVIGGSIVDLVTKITEDKIDMNLTDGSISGRPRGSNEEVLHHAELLELFVNLPDVQYALPISPPSTPLQEDVDDEDILNLFVNPLDPLVILQDISEILDDSISDEEDSISDEEDSISDEEEDASVIIMGGEEEQASVIIIGDEESPDVIVINESDIHDSVMYLGGPYEPGDTTYLDIGLNEGMCASMDMGHAFEKFIVFEPPHIVQELPLLRPLACSTPKPPDLSACIEVNLNDALIEEAYDVFGIDDAEATVIFVCPCVAEQIPEAVEALHFRPAASSTPIPMDI